MIEEIKVSVCVVTFNHEKYIRRAIDSVLMQKVSFPIEILVGDDCSTDKTPDILKEYEGVSTNLKIILRKENLWGRPDNNSWLLRASACGKYVITLEGDDFWLDEHKLQKQAEFLDHHEDFIAVAHRCVVVGDDSMPINEVYPECNDDEYTMGHFASDILPGQTATVMYRNIYRGMPKIDLSVLHSALIPGDRLLNFALLCYGRIGCLKDRMSAYRHVTTHGTSFSATYKRNFDKERHWLHALQLYASKNANQDGIVAVEIFVIDCYCSYIRGKNFSERVKALKCWCRDSLHVKSYWKYFIYRIKLKMFGKKFPTTF